MGRDWTGWGLPRFGEPDMMAAEKPRSPEAMIRASWLSGGMGGLSSRAAWRRETGAERRDGGASVEFIGVTKQYGSLVAVDNVSLTVEPGEFLTLLGPSGAGKSTLLMLLAGFADANAGVIRVDGRDQTRVPAHRRDQGVVFQNYVLFPHMTVRENLTYPLAARGIARHERSAMIARTADRVRLTELLDRYPHQLSGGQQQRVALARAIVFQPPLLLMDESLSALDRNLREEMQYELKDLHRHLRSTIVFVTHDQGEAWTMSDRVAVLQAGRLVQIGDPREIYERPVNSFVARFLGDTNFIAARVSGLRAGYIRLETDAGRHLLGVAHHTNPSGQRVQAMVRPEAVELVRRGPAVGSPDHETPCRLVGRVERRTFFGGFHRYWLRCDDIELSSKVPSAARNSAFEVGDEVDIVIHAKDLLVMED